MDLVFKAVEQPAIEDAGVLFFRRDDDGIGVGDSREIGTVRRDDLIGYPSLEDVLEFLTLLGIRPQYENGMRHYLCRIPKKPIAARL